MAYKDPNKAKEYLKAWKAAHRQSEKAKLKAWYAAHKYEIKAYSKDYYSANKEEIKAYQQEHKEEIREYSKAYKKSDLNSLGQTKQSIRQKSQRILKQMNLHIKGYEIHHCFGYEDASKFIYISKSLHRTIHKYLRDNNIDASSDHWMAIRELVNDTDEFTYIKC